MPLLASLFAYLTIVAVLISVPVVALKVLLPPIEASASMSTPAPIPPKIQAWRERKAIKAPAQEASIPPTIVQTQSTPPIRAEYVPEEVRIPEEVRSPRPATRKAQRAQRKVARTTKARAAHEERPGLVRDLAQTALTRPLL